MTANELLDGLNATLTYYEVVITDDALGEDGEYSNRTGYALLNKVTGIMEHSSTMLPGVMWQATHFEGTLKSMLGAGDDEGPTLATVEDIIPTMN